MKVHEIISEENALQILGKLAKKGLGKAFVSAEKPIELFASKSDAFKSAGEMVFNNAKFRNVSLSQAYDDAIRISPQELATYNRELGRVGTAKAAEKAGITQKLALQNQLGDLNDPGVKAKIISQAKAAVGSERLGQVTDKVVGGVKTTNTLVNGALKGADWLAHAAVNITGFVPAYLEFRKNIANAATHVGVDWTQEDFDSYADQQVGILVAKWTAVFVAGGLGNILGTKAIWSKAINSNIPGMSKIGRLGSIGWNAPMRAMMMSAANEYSDTIAKICLFPLVDVVPKTIGAIVRGAANKLLFGLGMGATPDVAANQAAAASSGYQSGSGTGQSGSSAGQGTQGSGSQSGSTSNKDDDAAMADFKKNPPAWY